MSTFQTSPIGTYSPQYLIRHVTIVSVFPVHTECTLRSGPIGTFIPSTTYALKGAPRDGYETLVVEDAQEWIMSDWEHSELRPVPKSAISLAEDCVKLWTTGTLGQEGGGRPGIAIARSETPDQAEIDAMVAELRQLQTLFAQGLVQDANDKETQGNRKYITPLHRTMAEWLYGEGAQALPWFLKRNYESMKACIACGNQIKSIATVCEKCGADLVERYVKYGMDYSADPGVSAFLAKATMPKAQVEPPLKPTEPKK